MKNILDFFRLYKCNILIKYYDQEFLIYNESDLKNVFKKFYFFFLINISMLTLIHTNSHIIHIPIHIFIRI